MKKILVLGSGSALGKKIITILEKKFIIICDKNKNKNFDYERFVKKYIYNIDIILNLVGHTGKNRRKLICSNFSFLKKIISIINKNKKKILFIHFSTIGVLDLKEKKRDAYKSNNFYEYTKKISEQIILRKKNNFNFLIIRPSAVIDIEKSRFQKNLKSTILFKKYLIVFDSEAKIYFTRIETIIESLEKLIKNKIYNKTINISYTLKIKDYFNKFCGIKVKLIIAPKLFTSILNFCSNINTCLNYRLDNKLMSYFWLYNSKKNINAK